MAIAPLDLQTLFAQMDKIGKEQAAVKEGAALHKAVQNEVAQRRTEERMQGIVEAEQTGAGLSSIQDNKQKDRQGGKKNAPPPKRQKKAAAEDARKTAAYRDPALGTYLDISG